MKIESNTNDGRFKFSMGGSEFGIYGASPWVSFRMHPGGKLQRAGLSRMDWIIHEEPIIDVHGKATQRIITCPSGIAGLRLEYRVKTYLERPFVLLQISITNTSKMPIFLDEFCLLDVKERTGGRILLGNTDEALNFFKIGWHGWDYSGVRGCDDRNAAGLIARLTSLSYTNPTTTWMNAKGRFSSEGWAMLTSMLLSLVTGFVSTATQFGQVYASLRQGDTAISLISQMDGVQLDPGEQSQSEWGYLQLIDLPHPEPQADYIEAVARQMQARVPSIPPEAMWTHWYQYFHDISEEQYLKNLDVLSRHRGDFPCQGTELDDGYQAAWGDWTSTNKKFPHGLEWLAEQVDFQGLFSGLWLAPFAVQAKSDLAKNHPGWLVKNNRNKPAKAGFLYNMFIHSLDLTRPDVQEHLHNMTQKLVQEWGYKMLKIDFLNVGAIPGRRSNPRMTRAQALRSGLEAIRGGAGEDCFLLGCGCPFGPAIGIVDAMRISPDTAPSWTPYFHWMKWAGPIVKSNPNMPALRNALRNTLNLSGLHRRWWWNDPDCLLIREQDSKLTEAEVQSEITLVGLSGGLIISSDNLQQLSSERMKWIALLTPNLGLRGLPVDMLTRDMPRIFQVKIENQGHAWQLVGLFNWEDQPADLTLKFSQLGYSRESMLHVFDFWQQKYQQASASLIVFHKVPAHGCKLLRVCEVGDVPLVVGDTLHISMGGEIKDLLIIDGEVKLELMDMGRNVDGKVWVWTGEKVVDVIVRNRESEVPEGFNN